MNSRHILIADDDASMRLMLETDLRAQGFRVSAASNGVELATLGRLLRPDLIISDIEMPRYSGPQAQTAMRTASRPADVPILFISGLAEEEVRRRLTLGPRDRFLPKPVDFPQLHRLLGEMMR